MKMKRILTERLELILMNFEIISSVLKSNFELIENLGLKTNNKWPAQDTLYILPIEAKRLENIEEPTGFGLWMIARKDNRIIIGDLGFKTLPNPQGEVEIGYGLIEDERRKGYGFEAVKGLVEWAFQQESVKLIKAECLADNIASIRILEKIGMHETERNGEMTYWEIKSPLCCVKAIYQEQE